MNEGLIPRRYAKALYKYAQDNGSADAIYEKLGVLVKAYAEHPKLDKAMSNPALSASDKEALLVAAFGEDPGNELLRFIRLVIKNRRETFMRTIALEYRSAYRNANGIALITIVTATQLDDNVLGKIRAIMQQKTDKKLEYAYQVDPTIIGGFILRVDSMQLDASVNNELKKLRLQLMNSKL